MRRRALFAGALSSGLPLLAQDRKLNLYIWSEYIDPKILKDFEALTGAKVIVTPYESNEDMVAKLQGGGTSQYDIVVPTDYIIPQMIGRNLLQPLDKKRLPNLKNLAPRFQNPPFDPQNKHTVAYQWGTVCLGYRKDKVKITNPSWSLIFDPQKQVGPFTLVDDQRPMIGAAAVYLGYDFNTTDRKALEQIQALLIATKKRSRGFIGGVGGKNQLLAGTATVAVVYNGDALRATQENPQIAYFVPKEGGNLWLDNLAIPARAPHPALAHQFINFILDPKIGARLSNFNRYATPNQSAMVYLTPQDRKDPAIYPPDPIMKKLYVSTVLKRQEARLIDTVWTNIKNQ